MRRSSAFSKVLPMPASASVAGSPRKSIVTRLRVRASTVFAMQRLNPFAHRQRRRRRRRSATTDQIVTHQHTSALSAVSMRSDSRHAEAQAVRALETVQGTAGAADPATSRKVSGSAKLQRATAEYLVALATFFFACDYDEDGVLTWSELQVVMEILTHEGAARRRPSRKRRRTGAAGEATDPAPAADPPLVPMLLEHDEHDGDDGDDATRRTTIEQFMDTYGHRLFAERVDLPSVDFVRRCQRLKLGFKRCDTNGDNLMSVQELEIALQKLDLVVADDDLRQLVKTLDANGDGTIEWSEMVRAAWLNTHLGPTRNRDSVLLLDALADVPAAAIGRPRNVRSQGSTTAVTPAESVLPGFSYRRDGYTKKKKKNKRANRPSWLTTAALKMHLILPQDAVDKRRQDDGAIHPRDPSKSRVERLGVRILTRISMQQVKSMKQATTTHKGRRSATSSASRTAETKPGPSSVQGAKPTQSPARTRTTVARTKLTPAMRRRVVRIEWIATVLAALIGVACGLVSIRMEAWVPRAHGQDLFSGDAFYLGYIAAINIGVSLLEVNLMYLSAVICAFRMTVATRLTLYPQDDEREFLTRAIARAALQVGHRTDTLFGMDPMKGSPPLVLLCSFLVYKSKRYVLKFLIKLFIRRVLWRAAAKTMLSVVVLPINAVLNAWTLRSVMRHCRVTIIGPPCITALLEEFFDRQEAKLLPYQRVDYLRVLGCALVCKRCVHPNLEIIVHQVRHRWVDVTTWPIGDGCSCLLCPDEPCELHELDDMDRFFASLMFDTSRLSPATAAPSICEVLDVDHQRNIFFFLILALIVDGELSLGERRLYVRACHIAHIQPDWPSVRKLKDQFLQGYGLRLDAMFEMIVPRPRHPVEMTSATELDDRDASLQTPWMDALLYIGDRLSGLLAV